MCWNQDISINTFLFASLALIFIYITNNYSKYKSKTFDNPLVYLFFFEVAFMQLIEFFLWRNLKNHSINEFLSKIGSFLITIQPVTIMLMIPNINYMYSLIVSYIVFVLAYFEYRRIYNPFKFHTFIGNNGHLSWEWMNLNGKENIFLIIYLIFYLLSLLLINNVLLSGFVIIALIISLINHYKYKTFATMWCWYTNLFFLYFIFDILIIKPFYEYNNLC